MMTLNKKAMIKLIQEDQRLDERKLDEFRDIEIIPNYIEKNPEGSAFVRIGNTQVVVGVKMGVGDPYSDSPDEGVLITNAELVPLASPEYESGPPREPTIELARVVDRGIRESNMIDLKSLCIKKNEKVRLLFLDMHVIDFDGNLFDACSLGAIVALLCTKIPKYDEEKDELNYDEYEGKLKLNELPVTVTARKIAGKTVFDPTAKEEEIVDARITMSFKKNGNICSIQKGDSGHLTKDEILDMMKQSYKKSKKLRKKIKSLKLDK